MVSQQKPPVKGGTRRNRKRMSMSTNGTWTRLRYSYTGKNVSTNTTGSGNLIMRHYVPGLQAPDQYCDGAITSPGVSVAGYYSTGVFRPGTQIRWEPGCSFTTSGRVIVGFTDNPEVIAKLSALYFQAFGGVSGAYNEYVFQIRGLERNVSFPVWQETSIPFPTRTRRKAFDADVDGYDGSDDQTVQTRCQMAMFAVIIGAPELVGIGTFWYHDELDVEGLHNRITEEPERKLKSPGLNLVQDAEVAGEPSQTLSVPQDQV